ncbi:MAG: transcriptional regulator, AraC family [Anaerocolumna sp.]|nr:transcriptional regulator, AraC family [Anaerocolumna sp.]
MSVKTIEMMIDWVDNHIKDNPTLEKMSENVGYSPYYCSIKFHEHVGMTFKQYKHKRKLSLSAIEVENSNKRFLDIALEYGFSSQEAFTRAFANVFGCTPYQYRKHKGQITS